MLIIKYTKSKYLTKRNMVQSKQQGTGPHHENTDFMIVHPGTKLSCVVRKSAFCICENKDADQLRGNREADQRLCFHYTDSTIPLLSKSENSKSLNIFCGCTARFVSDLVRNPEDRFSHNEAQKEGGTTHEGSHKYDEG